MASGITIITQGQLRHPAPRRRPMGRAPRAPRSTLPKAKAKHAAGALLLSRCGHTEKAAGLRYRQFFRFPWAVRGLIAGFLALLTAISRPFPGLFPVISWPFPDFFPDSRSLSHIPISRLQDIGFSLVCVDCLHATPQQCACSSRSFHHCRAMLNVFSVCYHF